MHKSPTIARSEQLSHSATEYGVTESGDEHNAQDPSDVRKDVPAVHKGAHTSPIIMRFEQMSHSALVVSSGEVSEHAVQLPFAMRK